MKQIKIKADFDHSQLENLGYVYAIMEGGYISKDEATVVSINRSPYKRQVMQFRPDCEAKHEANVEQLRQIGALESE